MDNSGAIESAGDTAVSSLNSNAHKIVGVPSYTRKLTQDSYNGGQAGDCYVIAGWAKGDSAPLVNGREFGIRLILHYNDGEDETFVARFNPDAGNVWQYAAAPVVAKKDYGYFTIQIAYDYNVNTVYFDGIQLFKEEFGSSYTYDTEGNVISVLASYTYTSDQNRYLERLDYGNGDHVNYTYDSYGRLTTETYEDGQKVTYFYDNDGALAKTVDSETGKETAWYYDMIGRLVKYTEESYQDKGTVLLPPFFLTKAVD